MNRMLTGTVVSDKMDKTVIVAVARDKRHPLYNKRYSVTKRFAADCSTVPCKTGDRVEIVETRPISKTKKFAVSRVISTDEVTK
jgi:small subunit ribosomal protein S17